MRILGDGIPAPKHALAKRENREKGPPMEKENNLGWLKQEAGGKVAAREKGWAKDQLAGEKGLCLC